MPRQARGEYVDPKEVQILHLVNRCVRRAFLCGEDPLTGKSFEHRREWIRQRLEFLASVFGIDCLTYTIMSNHIHLILRSRPESSKRGPMTKWRGDGCGCSRTAEMKMGRPPNPKILNCR